MQRLKKAIIPCTVLFLTSSMMFGQSAKGLELMKKNDMQMSSDNEQVELTMELINSKNLKRSRTIKRYSKTDAAKNESTLIQFLAPADVAGTGFLAIENTGREDDQWLYLPALKRSRRISASNESDNFMGSDFTYEDIGSEELDQFDYNCTGEVNIAASACYVIVATPATEAKKQQSGYAKREIYLDKNTLVVNKINYYDKKGELLKVLEAAQIKPVGSTGKYRAHLLTMKNLKTKNQTVLKFNNFQINGTVNAELFTKRTLESGM